MNQDRTNRTQCRLFIYNWFNHPANTSDYKVSNSSMINELEIRWNEVARSYWGNLPEIFYRNLQKLQWREISKNSISLGLDGEPGALKYNTCAGPSNVIQSNTAESFLENNWTLAYRWDQVFNTHVHTYSNMFLMILFCCLLCWLQPANGCRFLLL